MNLYQFFLDNGGVEITKNVHYFPIYERYMSRYVNSSLVLFEIGDGAQGAPAMWKRYFGPFATIVSLEQNKGRAAVEDDTITVRFGAQSDPGFLNSVLEEFGQPDIVIDDGTHRASHVISAFETLYPRMARDGIYLIEDTYTSYWAEYEGGLRNGRGLMDYVKDLADELHADHTRGRIPPTGFSRNTIAMHIHDGVVVFERGAYVTKRSVSTGS